MAIYRIVQRLAPDMAAYVAGLLDGEGTITLSAEHKGVGAGRITGKRTCSERHTPSFAYKVTSRQALDLLSRISGYIKTYQGQARADGDRAVWRVDAAKWEVRRRRDRFEQEFLALGPGPRGRPKRL